MSACRKISPLHSPWEWGGRQLWNFKWEFSFFIADSDSFEKIHKLCLKHVFRIVIDDAVISENSFLRFLEEKSAAFMHKDSEIIVDWKTVPLMSEQGFGMIVDGVAIDRN